MTMQSLQEIISLEEKLFAAEQAEQEKAKLWLQEQLAAISRDHASKLADLAREKEKATKRSAMEAKRKASTIEREAKTRAEYLDGLDDEFLKRHLQKILTFITGQTP